MTPVTSRTVGDGDVVEVAARVRLQVDVGHVEGDTGAGRRADPPLAAQRVLVAEREARRRQVLLGVGRKQVPATLDG